MLPPRVAGGSWGRRGQVHLHLVSGSGSLPCSPCSGCGDNDDFVHREVKMNRIGFKYLVFFKNLTVHKTLRHSPLRIKKQNKIGRATSIIPVAQVRRLRVEGMKVQCQGAVWPGLEPKPFHSIPRLRLSLLLVHPNPFPQTCLPWLLASRNIASKEKQEVHE